MIDANWTNTTDKDPLHTLELQKLEKWLQEHMRGGKYDPSHPDTSTGDKSAASTGNLADLLAQTTTLRNQYSVFQTRKERFEFRHTHRKLLDELSSEVPDHASTTEEAGKNSEDGSVSPTVSPVDKTEFNGLAIQARALRVSMSKLKDELLGHQSPGRDSV